MRSAQTETTGRPDYTFQPDTGHTYGMTFRFYGGNGKEMTRWFATPADGKRFAERNAIVPVEFVRSQA